MFDKRLKHLESFVEKRGMRLSGKLSILLTVTLLMGFSFFMMARKGIWLPCAILAIVWAAHIIYFGFRVKTLPREDRTDHKNAAESEDVA